MTVGKHSLSSTCSTVCHAARRVATELMNLPCACWFCRAATRSSNAATHPTSSHCMLHGWNHRIDIIQMCGNPLKKLLGAQCYQSSGGHTRTLLSNSCCGMQRAVGRGTVAAGQGPYCEALVGAERCDRSGPLPDAGASPGAAGSGGSLAALSPFHRPALAARRLSSSKGCSFCALPPA